MNVEIIAQEKESEQLSEIVELEEEREEDESVHEDEKIEVNETQVTGPSAPLNGGGERSFDFA
jgi:hypothetical protein